MAKTLKRKASIIAVIPAAGQTKLLGSSAGQGSKELASVGWEPVGPEKTATAKPACSYLFDALREAGVDRISMIIRPEKFDIVEALGTGRRWGVSLAYMMRASPHGVPYTIDTAYAHARGARVAVGFPDELFHAPGAFKRLLKHLDSDLRPDCVLGLFPSLKPGREERVLLVNRHEVSAVEPPDPVKDPPRRRRQSHSWALAVWSPAFTRWLHAHLRRRPRPQSVAQQPTLGQIFQEAIDDGLKVHGLEVSNQPPLDIGTPSDLSTARMRFGGGR